MTINFFGYGAYRNQERLEQVLGHEISGGVGAQLTGYQLAYQLLNDIPEPPREILRSVWGEGFRAYTLKSNPDGLVVGRLWQILTKDIPAIKEWEFDGQWRELIQVSVKASDGSEFTAYTDKALDKFMIHGNADGLNYQDLINERQPLFFKEDEVRKSAELTKVRKQLEMMKQYRQKLLLA